MTTNKTENTDRQENQQFEDPDGDDVIEALEPVDNGAALVAKSDRAPDLWVICIGDQYRQIVPSEGRTSDVSPSSARLVLKQRDRLIVRKQGDWPTKVSRASEGREPDQKGLGSF